MADVVLALGKKPPESKSMDKGGDSADEYTALAKGILRAVKDGDESGLASLLRDCGMLGGTHGDDDGEDY